MWLLDGLLGDCRWYRARRGGTWANFFMGPMMTTVWMKVDDRNQRLPCCHGTPVYEEYP